ncbi:MAG: DUF3857 domain-containing protein, partial [Proteobacteria bacterium]|nr:DUF3857 domain-containing protein [Pseudomonadota bacterium]
YTKITINKDLSYKETRRIVTKVLNYRGKKESSEKRIFFDSRFDHVKIDRSLTVKMNNGKYKVIPTDKNAIRILDAPKESGFMDYAVHKMEVVAFSNVERGNIVDLTYSVKNDKRQPFSDKLGFGYKEPIYKMHFEIVLPKTMKIEFNKVKGVKFTDKIVGSKRILTWEANNLPQIIREQNMPKSDLIVPTLYFSVYKNWRQFKDNLLKQYDNSVKVTPEVKTLVNSIVSKDDNKFQQVKKISLYLARRIANKNVMNLEDFNIQPVDNIIARGYAASFDRVAFFLSMMKTIGVEGYPVAIGPELLYWNNEKDFIQTEDFIKIIARVNINGKEYYVDPSNEFYPIGYIGEENRIGMAILPGDVKFNPVMNTGKFKNREIVDYNIKISKNGTARVFECHTYWGNEAVRMRSKYKYMTPVQKMQDYQKILGHISENVFPVSKNMSIDLGYPVKISYEYGYNNYAVEEGKFVYFDIPSNLVPFKSNKPPKQKQYPFVSSKNDDIIYNVNISYPSSLKPVIIPPSINLKSTAFDVSRTINTGKGEITTKDEVSKKYGMIQKTDYAEFYSKIMKLSHPKYYKVLMKKRSKFLGIF